MYKTFLRCNIYYFVDYFIFSQKRCQKQNMNAAKLSDNMSFALFFLKSLFFLLVD